MKDMFAGKKLEKKTKQCRQFQIGGLVGNAVNFFLEVMQQTGLNSCTQLYKSLVIQYQIILYLIYQIDRAKHC